MNEAKNVSHDEDSCITDSPSKDYPNISEKFEQPKFESSKEDDSTARRNFELGREEYWRKLGLFARLVPTTLDHASDIGGKQFKMRAGALI